MKRNERDEDEEDEKGDSIGRGEGLFNNRKSLGRESLQTRR